MIDKVVIVLAGLLTCTEVIAQYSAVPTLEHYSSVNNGPGTRRAYPSTPAPIFEENMDHIQSTYAAQQPQLFHVMNSPFPSPRRSSSFVNIGTSTSPHLSQSSQNSVLFQPAYYPPPDTSITGSTGPVTFTTHTHSRPLVYSYSGPFVATRYGHPAFASYTPVASQATIAYSKAPVVSHTAFSGHGSSFAW